MCNQLIKDSDDGTFQIIGPAENPNPIKRLMGELGEPRAVWEYCSNHCMLLHLFLSSRNGESCCTFPTGWLSPLERMAFDSCLRTIALAYTASRAEGNKHGKETLDS